MTTAKTAADRYRQATADEVAWRYKADQAANRRVEAIVRMRKLGMSYGKIAEATGLSRSRVQQLVERGQTE